MSLNEPRTVPTCLGSLGKRRAKRSHKVLGGSLGGVGLANRHTTGMLAKAFGKTLPITSGRTFCRSVMAPRANWKGYLRLSLVSCPIALYPASSLSEKVSFNRINRKTGNRLKQQNVDSETGEVVARDDTVRGYEVAKGQYMTVEDEEIESVQIESTRTIDIDQFVPKDEI